MDRGRAPPETPTDFDPKNYVSVSPLTFSHGRHAEAIRFRAHTFCHQLYFRSALVGRSLLPARATWQELLGPSSFPLVVRQLCSGGGVPRTLKTLLETVASFLRCPCYPLVCKKLPRAFSRRCSTEQPHGQPAVSARSPHPALARALPPLPPAGLRCESAR